MPEKTYINDGGAAFPRPASEFTKNGTLPDGNDAEDAQEGMTLRAYMATKAMQALVSNLQEHEVEASHWDRTLEWIPLASCALADALIAELKKGK